MSCGEISRKTQYRGRINRQDTLLVVLEPAHLPSWPRVRCSKRSSVIANSSRCNWDDQDRVRFPSDSEFVMVGDPERAVNRHDFERMKVKPSPSCCRRLDAITKYQNSCNNNSCPSRLGDVTAIGNVEPPKVVVMLMLVGCSPSLKAQRCNSCRL